MSANWMCLHRVQSWSRVGVPIGGAIALVAVAMLHRDTWQRPELGLSAAEHVRAGLFLARQAGATRRCADDALTVPRSAACTIDDHGDVDGDGRADCWRVRHGDDGRRAPDDTSSLLTVWPGCRGAGTSLEVWHEGTSLFVIPPELATPTWLAWIARRIAGPDAVACSGVAIASCATPGSEWDWLLASAERHRAQPGWYGTVAPRWSTGAPVTQPGALIVGHVPAGWMARYRGAEEGPPPDAPEGARIIVEAGTPPQALPITCAGLEIRSGRRGITAIDARGRWTWLFRGLPDYGSLGAAKLACFDDVVIASTGGSFAHVVAIDPRSGGWLYAPSYDAGPGAELRASPGGDVQWRDELGHVIPLRALHAWLATPAADRAPIDALAETLRPELAAPAAAEVVMVDGSRDPAGEEELAGEPFPAAAIASRVRASLVARGTCAGWTLASSPTAILAEHGTQARWLYIASQSSGQRITDVRCDRGRVFATRTEPGGDLLEGDAIASGGKAILAFDLGRDRWAVQRTK